MFLSLLAILISNTAFAGERYLLYMGGGGEPAKQDTTIFDGALKSMGDYLKSNSWHTDVRFNGGHATTESILNTAFPSSASTGPLTVENYKGMIQKYVAAINSGAVKPGDQLLVMIDTHGAEHNDFNNEKSHAISITAHDSKINLDNLAGSTTQSMDDLQPLIAAANAKGVKLAIADMSCHSGNTLALANDQTCVISSSGPNHYGFNSFSDAFIHQLQPGTSIEEAFLKTRQSSHDPSYPMISTPAGKTINQHLYAGITPFLFYTDTKTDADKLSPYLLNTAKKSCSPGADASAPFLSEIQKLKTALGDSSLDTNELQNLLRRYQNRQSQIVALLRSWGIGELQTVETCNSIGTYKNVRIQHNQSYSWEELLRSEFAGNISYLTEQMNQTNSAVDKADFLASLQCMREFQAKKDQIVAAHPDLVGYDEKLKSLRVLMNDTYQLASDIGAADRKIYQSLYEDLSMSDRKPNACKDFVL